MCFWTFIPQFLHCQIFGQKKKLPWLMEWPLYIQTKPMKLTQRHHGWWWRGAPRHCVQHWLEYCMLLCLIYHWLWPPVLLAPPWRTGCCEGQTLIKPLILSDLSEIKHYSVVARTHHADSGLPRTKCQSTDWLSHSTLHGFQQSIQANG
jgi:hypothetical protein